jgi:PiT family inorganic phosphate transporter
MRLLAALGAAGIALGGFTWGYRVIRTVGFRITRLDYVSGASAELANALVVWLFSKIPYLVFGYGMPISTTHASVSAIIGVGIAKHRSLQGVNWRTVGLIVAGWLLTLPVAASIGLAVYVGLKEVVHAHP